MSDGIEHDLAELSNNGSYWTGRGVVEAIEAHETYGWLYTVRLQPEQLLVQVRGCWLMGGAAEEGVFVPIAVEDEVAVFFAGGDVNRGVCFGSLPSTPNPMPEGWDGQTSILIKHLTRVAVEAPEVLLGSREATQAVALAPLVEAAVNAAVAAVASALSTGAASAVLNDGGSVALGAAATALSSFSSSSTAASKVKGE